MQRVFEMMLDALVSTWEAAAPWLTQLAREVPSWAWASLATLLALWIALRLLRPTKVANGAAPEVLLTRAELESVGSSGNGFAFELVAAFSNLHHEPVQLLRIAAAGGDRRAVVVDAPVIVAPRRAVEIEAELAIGGGGNGRLDLYLYVPASPSRAWRLRAPLSWDAFQHRFVAELLDQRVRPVRRLPALPAPPPPTQTRSSDAAAGSSDLGTNAAASGASDGESPVAAADGRRSRIRFPDRF